MTTDVADVGVGTLRSGIIGAGFMARVHAAAARTAGAHLTGIASSRPDRAAAAAQSLGITRAEADASALIAASDIDVVHICTPNTTHAPLAAAARGPDPDAPFGSLPPPPTSVGL